MIVAATDRTSNPRLIGEIVADFVTDALESERKRLFKEQDELQALLNKTRATLANEDYLAKAPPRLVEDSRKKAEDYEARLIRLAERLRQLA